MTSQDVPIEDLLVLNQIIETLNRAVDVRGALETALARLVQIMGLQTGWISLKDADNHERWGGYGYTLGAHLNLPPALALDNPRAWDKKCNCQRLCDAGELTGAYNEVRCSRLEESHADRQDLAVHASVPLRSGDQTLGILNVAARDWSAFSPRALALLTNVGEHMGAALERARLYDLLQKRHLQEQDTLLTLSNQLLHHRNLDDMFVQLVSEAPRLVGAETCALLIRELKGRDLKICAAHGWGDLAAESVFELSPEMSAELEPFVCTGSIQIVTDFERRDLPAVLLQWLRSQSAHSLAIAPLIADDQTLGAMLLTSSKPWDLDFGNQRFLSLLANQAAIAINQARMQQIELARQRMEAELDMGQNIQRSMLSLSLPSVPGWEFAAYNQPARQLGGDFYDIFRLPGDKERWGIVIADVVGKGVPAALIMVLCRTILRATVISARTPVSVMRRTNKLIRSDSGRYRLGDYQDMESIFISAVYATLEPESGAVIYVNAGHNRPLWLRSGGEIEELGARGIVLGLFAKLDLQQRQLRLAPGDSLVFYTDGITEATNAEGEPFGDQRLQKALEACRADSAQEITDALVGAVSQFVGGAEQSDDLTLFVVRRSAGE
ncbi:MAG: SpoIIE family protein phosphatase [Anaerolineales bacterium]|nr:SpoIIE family protein phosphatase [Anaerolineales bacterium]